MAINLTDALNAATTKGKLADAKQIYLEGDNKNLQDAHKDNEDHLNTLDTRSTQIEESLKTIAATGGASNANAVIYDNNVSGLTAINVKGALDELTIRLKDEFSYKGIAQPTTNPGTPEGNVFYIAGKGSYPNFNNQVVEVGQIAVLKWDGSWHKEVLEIGANGYNMTLEWNTDVKTTRKQVLQKYRKQLLQISYKNANGDIVNEQYVGTLFTDTEWVKDSNWEKIPNQLQIDALQSNIPKIIRLDNNDFIYDNTGVFQYENNLVNTYGTYYSTTGLIDVKAVKSIKLSYSIEGNKIFKPYLFYDNELNPIFTDEWLKNIANNDKTIEFNKPENAEYIEFRSKSSKPFIAEITYNSSYAVNIQNTLNSDIGDINTKIGSVEEIEIVGNSDLKVKTAYSGYSGYVPTPINKGILTQLYIPIRIEPSRDTFYITLNQGVGTDLEGNVILEEYKKITIHKSEITSDESYDRVVIKNLNIPLKNNTYIGIHEAPCYTVQDDHKKVRIQKSGVKGSLIFTSKSDRPSYFLYKYKTYKSLSDLVKENVNVGENITALQTQTENLSKQVETIENNISNFASLNDGEASPTETYSSQKIEERIAEIQNASANVQIVNAEGNSTTNGISQAAATLGLKKRMKIYKSVADMISDRSLSQDAACKTLGYYSINDGGGAEYYITEEETTEDGGSVINLSNGLKAKLISDFTVYNVLQWGWTNGFTYNGVNTRDITDTLTRIKNHILTYKLQNTTKPTKIFIPNGMYSITSTISLGANIMLEGNTPCSYAINTGGDTASLIITNFKGVVFEGSRFYLRDIGFINTYNSTRAEDDVWLCNAPKEIRGCGIKTYDYVAKSFVSVAEMCHCVCWIIRKSVVSDSMVDSIIHHNLITGMSWNTQQNCETTAFKPIIMNACAISDNYIDFFTSGIAPTTEIRSLTIQNNVLDYMPKPIVLSGCMNASIIGNRFYHISKQFVNNSNGKYPDDSTYRTTDWDCILIGASVKSVAIMGNCFDSCDTFLNGLQCSELHIYGNLLNNGSLKTKYAGNVLNSTKVFGDDIEN